MSLSISFLAVGNVTEHFLARLEIVISGEPSRYPTICWSRADVRRSLASISSYFLLRTSNLSMRASALVA